MYILPQTFKCDKCGHEEEYSPDHARIAPIFESGPVCSRCFEEFIKANCGTLKFKEDQ